MMKKLIYGLIACLCLGINPVLAQDEPPPTPDLWPTEIIAPNGIVIGPNNQIKVIITNLVKDSEVSVPVKIELVVIQAESGERASYFAEVEGMKHNQIAEDVTARQAMPVDAEKAAGADDTQEEAPLMQIV